MNVRRPRLRHKADGKVAAPVYQAMREDENPGKHMLGAMMRGISTGEYHEVLLEMAII